MGHMYFKIILTEDTAHKRISNNKLDSYLELDLNFLIYFYELFFFSVVRSSDA